MPKNSRPAKVDQIVKVAAELVELARNRRMGPDQLFRVGDVIDQQLQIQEPKGLGQSLIWDTVSPIHPQDLIESIRSLLSEPSRSKTSNAYLLEQVGAAAFCIGQCLLANATDIACQTQAETKLSHLISDIENSQERHEVVIPLINIVLNVPDGRIMVGPVEIVSDRLDAYLFDGGDPGELGIFGQWVVSEYRLEKDEEKCGVPPAFQTIGAYAHIRDLPGDRQAAIQHARMDIGRALSIIKMISFQNGSWSDQKRFGTYGSFYDPIRRFGMLGMPMGGTTFTLIKQLDNHNSGYFFQMDQDSVPFPVVIEGKILGKMKNLIELLARNMWAGHANWKELRLAVKSFNEGLDAQTAEDAFLKYVIAMDVLLGKEEKGWAESQTTRLSERIAFLLGDNDPPKRWHVYTAFQKLYSIRSGIVHSGKTITDHDVQRMEAIARLAILRLHWEVDQQNHANLDSFIDHVRRVKFGDFSQKQVEAPDFLKLSEEWFG